MEHDADNIAPVNRNYAAEPEGVHARLALDVASGGAGTASTSATCGRDTFGGLARRGVVCADHVVLAVT